MSFYLKALRGVFVSEKNDQGSRLQKLEKLQQKLVDEGYQPSEAEHFVRAAVGSGNLQSLDNNQLDAVIKNLEAQIKIAQKCKNIF